MNTLQLPEPLFIRYLYHLQQIDYIDGTAYYLGQKVSCVAGKRFINEHGQKFIRYYCNGGMYVEGDLDKVELARIRVEQPNLVFIDTVANILNQPAQYMEFIIMKNNAGIL
ncbi:MAG: hypothetical protein Unbinned4162contig1001_23 [Prokaryotic dsDNA virus sp.]|nr:MAG: hypothetical protein Unbinned4162contig1001_23 [Prokaryotic dsDNA virus sp.]